MIARARDRAGGYSVSDPIVILMAMSTVYFTAASLDGFIVDTENSLDWLISRDIDPAGAFGFEAFTDTVGALVMGSATYEWLVENQPGAWMYEQPSWVLTHRQGVVADAHPVQTYAGAVVDLHPLLIDAAAGKDVWVVGGGEVAAQFVAAGLVDQMIVSYAPCSLGAGARLLPVHSEWALAESGVNGEFICARWVRAG
jgi:dihydrofolate reductase